MELLLADVISNAPFMGSHRRRMESLLKHFHAAGLTLEACSDRRRLNRKVSTLKPYVRRIPLAFPDYVPLCLRPEKPIPSDGET